MEELQRCYKENILMVINKFEVRDFSISGGKVEYILVLNDPRNRAILETICTIAQSDFNIDENTEDYYINIAPLGFEFGEWWIYSEGFQLKVW